jgi:hypothetical protein
MPSRPTETPVGGDPELGARHARWIRGLDRLSSMLWWAVLQDVTTNLHRVDCPVMLAQGAVDVVGAG